MVPNGKLVLKRASQGRRSNLRARPQLGFSLYEIQPNVRSASSAPVELDCLERKERGREKATEMERMR